MKKIIVVTTFMASALFAQDYFSSDQTVAYSKEQDNQVESFSSQQAGYGVQVKAEIQEYLNSLDGEQLMALFDDDAKKVLLGGGMDSGGGDAVILQYCKSLGCARKGVRLYSLDLAEYGIQDDPSIQYEYEGGERIYISQKNILLTHLSEVREFSVANRQLFDELINYGQIFGLPAAVSNEALENTSELRSLGGGIRELKSQISDIDFRSFRANALARAAGRSSGLAELSKEDKARKADLEMQLADLQTRYLPLIEQRRAEVGKSHFNKEALVAVGLVNKIEEIRAVDSEFAQQIEEVLLDLEWLLVDLPIKELNDEGEIAVVIDRKIQIATRRHGIVRLANEGWTEQFKLNNEWIDPLSEENKIAVIMHEVLYEITKRQGDVTSERARNATARLFLASRPKRNIEKAAKMIMR